MIIYIYIYTCISEVGGRESARAPQTGKSFRFMPRVRAHSLDALPESGYFLGLCPFPFPLLLFFLFLPLAFPFSLVSRCPFPFPLEELVLDPLTGVETDVLLVTWLAGCLVGRLPGSG